jgi:hypothetical protein
MAITVFRAAFNDPREESWRDYGVATSTTRRLSARPSSVMLSRTGTESSYPRAQASLLNYVLKQPLLDGTRALLGELAPVDL